MAKIVLELVNKITESIEIGQVNVMPGGLFDLILNLVINILLVLIYFQFVKRGMEVFILRLGMPIACVGLIESDQGSFKPYLQEFFQSMFAIIVQLFLVKLVFVVLQTGDIQAIMLAIPICMTALSTPKFLAKFVSSTGGGGGLNAIYQGSRMLQMAKGLARR